MLFYEIKMDVTLHLPEERTDRYYAHDVHDEMCNDISGELSKLYAEDKKNPFIFLSNADILRSENKDRTYRLSLGAIGGTAEEIELHMGKFEKRVDYAPKNIRINETTYNIIRRMLSHNRYMEEDDENILEIFDLPDIQTHGGNAVPRKEMLMVQENLSLDECLKKAKPLLCNETLIPELERIYAGSAVSGINGIPVQYLICVKNNETREQVKDILMDALYDNGRFENSRVVELEYKNGGILFGPSEEDIKKCTYMNYKLCKGGLAVINYLKGEPAQDGDLKTAGSETLENICECISFHRNTVQTFFCLPGESSGVEKLLLETMGDVPVVKICEDLVNEETAAAYLETLADEHKVETDPGLFREVEDTGNTFTATDILHIFNRWYNDYVKTKVYPQYAVIQTAEAEVAKKDPEGLAYDKLKKMTGLTEAKKVIDQAIDYYKAQKLFAERGMKKDRLAMHMLFTGNPGTAKTTVARLFARILKDNGILSEGKLFELGRADLVGKYVGWTAPIVKRKFAEAKGSVLFIDEAYSLVDDRDGMYGDEAINTIVAEMENNRDDVVVIFAGYPKKMDGFLDKNPGLRSRIAFHVPFEDYNAEELFDIAGILSEEKGVRLSANVKDKLIPIFERAAAREDFGNGRFVRNMIETAKMKQATRLVHSDLANVTTEDVQTLTAEDFEEPVIGGEAEKIIGFSS